MTETTNKKFDINIVVLGCESTGKTTVVNALCGGEYSEANYGRTTEGINIFRLSKLPEKEVMCIDLEEDASSSKHSLSPISGDVGSNKRARTLEWTFNKIKENNEALRQSKKRGQESKFDIALNELPITMRNDAQLVITESPGMNASKDINKEARAYIEEKWASFDAALLVMDARQSVDYDDQMESLRFVHKLCSSKKEIPVFILCNKVDDPEFLGAEEKYKLKAVREKVQDQWQVDCRKRALEQLLAPECSKYEPVFPVFVPTSAKTAYLLRAGSAVSKKEFSKKMPVEYFHSIGQQEFGKKWKDMSEEAKHEAIHDHLMDPGNRKNLLRMSGFDKFLGALEICIGGDQAQLAMIRKNFMRDLEMCDFSACDMMSKLSSMNEKRQILGEPNKSLKAKFWGSYPTWADPAIDTFQMCYRPDVLAMPAQKLVEYQRFCMQQGWTNEIEKVQLELATLVTSMIATINNQARKWNDWKDDDFDEGLTVEAGSWASLSPVEWTNILSSILLLRSEKAFCKKFGRGIIILEKLLLGFFNTSSTGCAARHCNVPVSECGHNAMLVATGTELDTNLNEKPCFENEYKELVRFPIPDSYESFPDHFAHVGWLFCEAVAESGKYLESS